MVHRLIGAEVSFYTGKVRAYLRYKAIPFEEVAATRDVFREVIVPRTGVRFIPVLLSDDDIAVQDSSAIIDFLEQRYSGVGIYPEAPLQRLVALLLTAYADEWLVIPAMHYRWNVPENRAFAMEEFGRLSLPTADLATQRALGEKLAGPFAGALPSLGITPNTVGAIEASYLALLAELERHLETQPFLLGTRPCIGDFALYGPLYAHLYRDPASGRLMNELAPRVADWVARMTSPRPLSGSFLPDDQVPETLEPILTRMFTEFGPVLCSTAERLASWAQQPHEAHVPRSIGLHEFTLGDVRETRSIAPFNLWRWQPPRALYHSLSGETRARADALLARCAGLTSLRAPCPELARENNQLKLV